MNTVHHTPVACVIMASGLSSRMGKAAPDKLALTITDKPIYEYALDCAHQALEEGYLSEVAYVSHDDQARQVAHHRGFCAIENPSRTVGKSQSIVRGINALELTSEHGVMFMVADQPLLSVTTIKTLISVYASNPTAIIVPLFAGSRGNPVIFPPAAIPYLKELQGDQGGNVIMSKFDVIEVPIKDAWEGYDIDTPEQLESLREHMCATIKDPLKLREAPDSVLAQARESHAKYAQSHPAQKLTGPLVIIRGAGDLATGVIQQFVRAGMRVLALELNYPLTIRRTVALSEAVYEKYMFVEDIACFLGKTEEDFAAAWEKGACALAIDPQAQWVDKLKPAVVIDATLAKRNIGTDQAMAPVTIALGPGYEAGKDVSYVIETMRGHDLGRLITSGFAHPNTGIPGNIAGKTRDRVVHAPADGTMHTILEIGAVVQAGQTIAYIDDVAVSSHIDGLVRGLLRDGLSVKKGLKIADVDPRGSVVDYMTISDKARALGSSTLGAALMGLSRTAQNPYPKASL